jgi:hypothetical protein
VGRELAHLEVPMAKIIECPHCGAENPYSLLITVCQHCKGDISDVEPTEGAPGADGRAAAPPERIATAGVDSVADQQPPAKIAPEEPAMVVGQAGEPPAPAPAAAPKRRVRVPVTEVAKPPIAPAAAPDPGAAATRYSDGRLACPRCGFINPSGALACSRCRAAVQPVGAGAATGFRSCPRCGHRQDAGRNSCEKCGLHFVGPEFHASTILDKRPLNRAPRGTAEAATTALAVTVGCLIPFVVGLVFALLAWLGSAR